MQSALSIIQFSESALLSVYSQYLKDLKVKVPSHPYERQRT